ncbi:MAG: hypothetical protein IPJ46_01960 [Anaerolineales bacterium]|nr:hypothetical protein [Anaerolineales bacterium]
MTEEQPWLDLSKKVIPAPLLSRLNIPLNSKIPSSLHPSDLKYSRFFSDRNWNQTAFKAATLTSNRWTALNQTKLFINAKQLEILYYIFLLR